MLARISSAVAIVALAVWMGGLVALGAIAAPIVFRDVSMPSAADAMTHVFRRFDLVAMSCAAAVLVAEAMRAVGKVHFAALDHARAALSVLAAIAAVVEGEGVAPRIQALHQSGAIRGVGAAGAELSRLHDLAETIGKSEVVALLCIIVLHLVALSRAPSRAPSRASVASR